MSGVGSGGGARVVAVGGVVLLVSNRTGGGDRFTGCEVHVGALVAGGDI